MRAGGLLWLAGGLGLGWWLHAVPPEPKPVVVFREVRAKAPQPSGDSGQLGRIETEVRLLSKFVEASILRQPSR